MKAYCSQCSARSALHRRMYSRFAFLLLSGSLVAMEMSQ